MMTHRRIYWEGPAIQGGNKHSQVIKRVFNRQTSVNILSSRSISSLMPPMWSRRIRKQLQLGRKEHRQVSRDKILQESYSNPQLKELNIKEWGQLTWHQVRKIKSSHRLLRRKESTKQFSPPTRHKINQWWTSHKKEDWKIRSHFDPKLLRQQLLSLLKLVFSEQWNTQPKQQKLLAVEM